MTQEQDIVERLLEKAGASLALYRPLYEEAAQTIAALRAERDEMLEAKEHYRIGMLEWMATAEAAEANAISMRAEIERPQDDRHYWFKRANQQQLRAEAAEARVKELEETANFWTSQTESAKERIAELGRERDEARKALAAARDVALEEAANAIDDMQCIGPCYAHYDNMSQTIRDLRRARAASSNREGGEE